MDWLHERVRVRGRYAVQAHALETRTHRSRKLRPKADDDLDAARLTREGKHALDVGDVDECELRGRGEVRAERGERRGLLFVVAVCAHRAEGCGASIEERDDGGTTARIAGDDIARPAKECATEIQTQGGRPGEEEPQHGSSGQRREFRSFEHRELEAQLTALLG